MAHNAGEIDQLRSVWDALHTSDLTLFQSFSWNSLAAQQFIDVEEPYFVLAEDDNGAAIIPAVLRRESQELGLAG
ncbi:MAG TPA: hypothetical protein VM912_19560, partial [Terriglobales bacterium]|nr:hypothetical protein [Terriglobales bacterium]